MTKKWIFQLPVILLFTAAYCLHQWEGRVTDEAPFFWKQTYLTIRRVSSFFTDMKFKLRGAVPAKSRIVIVEIDSHSIDNYGRWPWHRDLMSLLVDTIFKAEPKVVGLDILFSEPDPRVPVELTELLKKEGKKFLPVLDRFDSDRLFARIIGRYSDRLVLAWANESACQPQYDSKVKCPVTDEALLANQPPGFSKFAIGSIAGTFRPEKTPIVTTPEVISNIPDYDSLATHSGAVFVPRDPDGNTRRASLVMGAYGKLYPSLALEVARTALKETLRVELNDRDQIQSLMFEGSHRVIPVSQSGIMDINYRGPEHSFSFVSAADILAKDSQSGILKDAVVLVGLTAMAVGDLASTPFSAHTPGVEIQANILDNLLSGDILRTQSQAGFYAILFLMLVGVPLLLLVGQRLEALPLLALFSGSLVVLMVVDGWVMFPRHFNLDTGFLYVELSGLLFVTLALDYVAEEKNKKFLREAFSRYVSPVVVEALIRDHSKLSVGGQKKELTVLFADIRNFTSLSETMDAKQLSELLNDFFGAMTEIVFKHGGTLDKFIGDALMAFWGAPLDHATHAESACLAAREMAQKLVEMQDHFRIKYQTEIHLGIGINTGVMNVGNMGSERNFDYTVIGDEVNLASRLEETTKLFGISILATPQTLRSIESSGRTAPASRSMGRVRLRGRKQTVEVIQILDRALPNEGLTLFEQGRDCFRKGEIEAAKEKFEAASELISLPGSQDVPCQIFLARCERKLSSSGSDLDLFWDQEAA